MGPKFCNFGFRILCAALVSHIWFQLSCHGQNLTTSNSEIDYETLSLFGFTHELADQFRINLIKAIEAAKDEADKVDPLRQGEFGGVSGGFFQGGDGGGGGGGGVGNNQEEEEEEEEASPTTPGPGAFGVLSGLFGIFSGLAGLNPSRIVQSTVNFFPPGQRMRVQMVVDSLIGYTPPENRTSRPRPRRPTSSTPVMVISETMMKEVTEASAVSTNTSESAVVQKGGESDNGTALASNDTTVDLNMSEVVEAPPEPATTQGFINVHKLLEKNTTPSPQDEDDENDFEKGEKVSTTEKPKSNSSMAVYKLKVRAPENQVVETRGVVEENNATLLSNTTIIPSTNSTNSANSTTSPSA